MLCNNVAVTLLCNQALECVSGMHIYIQEMVVVSWCSSFPARCLYWYSYSIVYYRIMLHVTKGVCTQFNVLMIYIYIWFNWWSHLYKLLNQTYVLLFGVHIRDLLDKSFCRVTYTTQHTLPSPYTTVSLHTTRYPAPTQQSHYTPPAADSPHMYYTTQKRLHNKENHYSSTTQHTTDVLHKHYTRINRLTT